MRPNGSKPAKTSIENGISDAVSLSVQDIEGSSPGGREFRTTSLNKIYLYCKIKGIWNYFILAQLYR